MYCPRCKRYDLTEADFGKDRSSKTGLQGYCKPCDRQKSKEHYAANAEAGRATQQQYYRNHAAEEAVAWQRWAKANPDKIRAQNLRDELRRQAAFEEEVDELAIYERDAWTCQICKQPVDPLLKYPHRMSASMDHIIPRARGGKHKSSNVQLAHLSCNSRKGVKLTS